MLSDSHVQSRFPSMSPTGNVSPESVHSSEEVGAEGTDKGLDDGTVGGETVVVGADGAVGGETVAVGADGAVGGVGGETVAVGADGAVGEVGAGSGETEVGTTGAPETGASVLPTTVGLEIGGAVAATGPKLPLLQ